MDLRTSIDNAQMVQRLHRDCTNNYDSNIHHKCNWKPPAEDFVKLNVDGAIFFNPQKVGIGAIFRDNKGDIIMAASLIENKVPNLETIETLAIPRGLQLCAHLGIPKILLKSDCLLVMKELH